MTSLREENKYPSNGYRPDKYRPDKYRYGYLVDICSCGKPSGMYGSNGMFPEGDVIDGIVKCVTCSREISAIHITCISCGVIHKNCGIEFNGNCRNCQMLERRGLYTVDSSKHRCKHCFNEISLWDVDYSYCIGCQIEPMACNIKPATRK